jgi:hypothetical protein
VYLDGAWHDDVPVYAGEALGRDVVITGPALVARPFTTVVLRPPDRATVQANGDLLVEITA